MDKRLINFPDYTVSELGIITNIKTGKVLTGSITPKGYVRVTLRVNNKPKTVKVHRLVAETFIPNPENKPTVNHIDEDKTNNVASNLEWATMKEQNNHGTRTERMRKTQGHKILCIETGIIYDTIKEASLEMGLHDTNIGAVLNGQYKQIKGYTFKRV